MIPLDGLLLAGQLQIGRPRLTSWPLVNAPPRAPGAAADRRADQRAAAGHRRNRRSTAGADQATGQRPVPAVVAAPGKAKVDRDEKQARRQGAAHRHPSGARTVAR
jgi:hypothetical protein